MQQAAQTPHDDRDDTYRGPTDPDIPDDTVTEAVPVIRSGMPERPAYRSIPRDFSGSEASRPAFLHVVAAVWVLALLVAVVTASAIFFDKAAVQDALRQGLRSDNPSRSAHTINNAVNYTLFGLLAGACVLTLINGLCLASTWGGNRRARIVHTVVALVTAGGLVGAWLSLHDARATAYHLTEWGPIAVAILVIIGTALLFAPPVRLGRVS
ncbi:hypothetical protein [Jongsikchunia kroppenstedtii]|uniref:hypothetical protein n=1 Tax=Jongsikchunia kroppenstedtii TaxID=1121721 RepID=UPI000366426B|nr:hypothetical protein [Jongsikchunia kroppenstedtii]